MQIIFEKSIASGTVEAPPSKSYAHRYLICAALTGNGAVVKNVTFSRDICATLDCITALGGEFTVCMDSVYFSKPMDGNAACGIGKCGESGSTLRFLLPLSLALCGEGKFCGTERLLKRGISTYEELLSEKGISFTKASDSVRVSGELRPGVFRVRGDVSSQFISGLLFALPLLDGDSRIELIPPVESCPYIAMTLHALEESGVKVIKESNNSFIVPGNQSYSAQCLTVEGDWSNAAYLFALNLTGGRVDVKGLCEHSLQGDKVCLELFRRLQKPHAVIDIADCIDLGPVLFSAAALLYGGTFTGVRRLRLKESDRVQSMAEELKKFSVQTDAGEDSFTVHPGELTAPAETLSSHNDHRIAMALSLLCTTTGGTLENAEAVEKSWPDFFRVLSAMGIKMAAR